MLLRGMQLQKIDVAVQLFTRDRLTTGEIAERYQSSSGSHAPSAAKSLPSPPPQRPAAASASASREARANAGSGARPWSSRPAAVAGSVSQSGIRRSRRSQAAAAASSGHNGRGTAVTAAS